MDQLPKYKDLVFERVRKELYLRLTKVIQKLANKFRDAVEGERVYRYIESLEVGTVAASYLSPADSISKHENIFYCVIADVNHAAILFREFVWAKNGGKRYTKKIHAGIERLEWLNKNWDDLEIVGDTRNGYRLELKT